jgi:molecular chaperone DnaK
MKTNEKFFGIDFGTTNTAVFLLDVDEHGIRPVYYGEDEMPFSSTIAIHKKNGSVLIGRQVKLNRQQLSKDYQIFSSIKSMLGKPTEYIVAGKTYTPVDIIALFLEQIKKKIQIDYGTVIEQATFAIPVDFTPLQRIELKQAAQMAGIKVNGLISESTASYMQSVEALKGFSKVAVFDWGGGTLDISILEVENKELRELAISGINLGGDDIDKILARKLHADIAAKHPIGSFDDISDKDKEQILYRCEQAKINLSGNDFTRILLSDYVIPSVIRIPLELDRFEEIILPHLEKAIETLENTVRKAGISVAQLDAILVVGGSSEMKPLQKIMYERYEKRNIKVVYPDKMQW